MTSRSFRMMLERSLEDGATMDASEVLDLGDYRELEIVVTVLSAAEGEAPTLSLLHAPIHEDGAWLDFAEAVSVDLLMTGATWVHVDHLTRWVGWRLSGRISGSATVTIDIVAKA